MHKGANRPLPQVLQRLDDVLLFNEQEAGTLLAKMPDEFFQREVCRKTKLLATGALCSLGWWWLTGKEGDLPSEIPSDFADNASRCEYLAERLELIGDIGSRLLPQVLPLGEISNATVAAQTAMRHWFDIVRSQSDNLEDVIFFLKQWLYRLEATAVPPLNAWPDSNMVLYTQ